MEKQNQTEQSSKNHKKGSGQIIILAIYIIIILIFVALCSRIEPPEEHYVEINTLTGTVTVKQIDVDKILEEEKAKRDSIISKLENSFTKEYDEFENRYWIKPKNSPKYVNMNGCYCYFQMNQDSTVSNFRFVFQYFAADWLFIDRMIFNIDGENTTIIPDMNTDHANGNIWEWCDVSVDKYSSTNESFILKLANAKSVKVKLIGSNSYYKIKTLSEQQIKSIKETYNYYKALGGEF